MKRRLGRIVLLIVFIIVCLISVKNWANEDEDKKEVVSQGRIIVKFHTSSSLGGEVVELFENNIAFESISHTPYLDSLNEKYQLMNVTKVFKSKLDIEEIKRKFPERSKRIPKGAKLPNLDYTYTFEFSKENLDWEMVSQEYALDDNVEYAQPDYTVVISNDIRDVSVNRE